MNLHRSKLKMVPALLTACLSLCLITSTRAAAASRGESVWDGTTVSPSLSGAGTEADPYLIGSAADLVCFVRTHNESAPNSPVSGYVRLTADIVFNDGVFAADGTFTKTGESAASAPYEWTPIGQWTGVFDGGGHHISGLSINADNGGSNAAAIGFFTTLRTGAVVKNLTIKNSYISTPNDAASHYVGIFAGSAWAAVFENCVSAGNILNVRTQLVGTRADDYAGGISGTGQSTLFDHCSNSSQIFGGGGDVGGICGKSYGRDRIYNCVNTGAVASNAEELKLTLNLRPIQAVGGILGSTESASEILNCANLGTVSSGTRVGGILGSDDGRPTIVRNSYSLNTVSGCMEYNTRHSIGILIGTRSSLCEVTSCFVQAGSALPGCGAISGTGSDLPAFTLDGPGLTGLMEQLNLYLQNTEGSALRLWIPDPDVAGCPVPNGQKHVDPATYYDLWVGGVHVSDLNCADIFADDPARCGLASYDSATDTLTLRDGLSLHRSARGANIYSESDLTIQVEGSVSLKNQSGNSTGSYSVMCPGSALTVRGPTQGQAKLCIDALGADGGLTSRSLTLDGNIYFYAVSEAQHTIAVRALSIQDPDVIFDAIVRAVQRWYNSTTGQWETTSGAMWLYAGDTTFNICDGVSLYQAEMTYHYDPVNDHNTLYLQPYQKVSEFELLDERYSRSAVRVASDANHDALTLIDNMSSFLSSMNWTVSMRTANSYDKVGSWVEELLRSVAGAGAVYALDLDRTSFVPARSGAVEEEAGTNGSFHLDITLGEGLFAVHRSYAGTITADSYLSLIAFDYGDGEYNVPAGISNTAITPIALSAGLSGGTPPYSYSLDDAPSWLSLSSDGVLSGTRPYPQSYLEPSISATTATVVVTDSASPAARKVILLQVGTISRTGFDVSVLTAVEYIYDLPQSIALGADLPLSGTVYPANATNQAIVWSLDPTNTNPGARVVNGVFRCTTAGPAVLRATVIEGKGKNADYVQTFTVSASARYLDPVLPTGISGVPQRAIAGLGLPLTVATVTPADATRTIIDWSVLNDGGTHSTVENSVLTAMYEGVVTLKATIIGAAPDATYYTKTFDISVADLPSSLLAPTILRWEGRRALWSSAANAESYTVQLYQNGEKLGEPRRLDSFFLSSGIDFSAAILGGGGGTYTFKVKSVPPIGSTDYSSSVYSAPSPVYHYASGPTMEVVRSGAQAYCRIMPNAYRGNSLLLAAKYLNGQLCTPPQSQTIDFADAAPDSVVFSQSFSIDDAFEYKFFLIDPVTYAPLCDFGEIHP